MIRALYTAASGMSAQQMNLDTIANNLANSSTTGFRQLRLQFQDMVYQNMVTPGAAQSQSTVSAGLQIGLGTKSAATEVINSQGALNETDNPLDVAIQGTGFFQVQRPDGTIGYSRAGQFHLNNQGTIVTTDGDPIIPTITIPSNATAVTITEYGVVNASLAGQQNPSQLGQIQLATFPNPGGLESMGSNLLQATLSSGDPVLGNPGGTEGLGTLQQGYLENSNEDVVTEFVQMVLAQRAYESNSKVIKAADDMYSQVNNMTRYVAGQVNFKETGSDEVLFTTRCCLACSICVLLLRPDRRTESCEGIEPSAERFSRVTGLKGSSCRFILLDFEARSEPSTGSRKVGTSTHQRIFNWVWKSRFRPCLRHPYNARSPCHPPRGSDGYRREFRFGRDTAASSSARASSSRRVP